MLVSVWKGRAVPERWATYAAGMGSGRGIRRPLLVQVAVLASVSLLSLACGSASTTGTESPVTSSCVTAVTTIPGEVFCDGYDPDLELSSDEGQGDSANDCPLDPLPAAGRPDDGWLGTETSGSTQKLSVFFDPQPAAGHPDRIRLAEAATEAVPPGFELVAGDALGDLRCPETPIVISASFANDAGEEISILWTHLRAQIDWFNEPLSGDVDRSALDDGTEIVANNFGGLGQKHRVWAARPDGSVIKIIVAGANAPSQAGWPTTTARFDGDDPEALPAPLTLTETVDLALELLD
jgi:hypothetical protein